MLYFPHSSPLHHHPSFLFFSGKTLGTAFSQPHRKEKGWFPLGKGSAKEALLGIQFSLYKCLWATSRLDWVLPLKAGQAYWVPTDV